LLPAACKIAVENDAKNPAQSAENTGGKYCSKQPSTPPSILAYSAQSVIYNLLLFQQKIPLPILVHLAQKATYNPCLFSRKYCI
jgi:hypothetical protein